MRSTGKRSFTGKFFHKCSYYFVRSIYGQTGQKFLYPNITHFRGMFNAMENYEISYPVNAGFNSTFTITTDSHISIVRQRTFYLPFNLRGI